MNYLYIDTTDAYLTVMKSFDTDTRLCVDSSPLRHSTTLMPVIDDLVGEDKSRLEAIAVNVGPGSFTGIRIGVTTAKIIGMGLKIPVIPFTTFELLAYQEDVTDRATVVVDAGNKLFYAQEFLGKKPVGKPCEWTVEEFTARLASGERLVGVKDNRCARPKLDDVTVPKAIIEDKIKAGSLVPYGEIEPLYIQLSQAEKEAKK